MHYSDSMEVGKNKMNLAEALMYLEDIEVCSDSDSESDIAINHEYCTRIFIQPPVDANGNISDIDSASEEELSINNLRGNQLLATAALELKEVGKGGRVSVGQLSNDNTPVENQTESDVPASSSTRIKSENWVCRIRQKKSKTNIC